MNITTLIYLTHEMFVILRMKTCACPCGCQREFDEISDQSLALLVALSERRIPHDKTICGRCRLGKHRKRKLRTKPISVRV